MKRHELKIDSELFRAVELGKKTAELRFNDRNYAVGDILIIYPFDRKLNKRASPKFCCREVTHITHGGEFGIESGYCLLSMKQESTKVGSNLQRIKP
tara:strand:- start:35 stop:325 length:291 start_codon:yes stop_codon:yes gene_type:complete